MVFENKLEKALDDYDPGIFCFRICQEIIEKIGADYRIKPVGLVSVAPVIGKPAKHSIVAHRIMTPDGFPVAEVFLIDDTIQLMIPRKLALAVGHNIAHKSASLADPHGMDRLAKFLEQYTKEAFKE